MNRSIRNLRYDVVVVGGGSAGVAAAVGAATAGMKTLLVEKNPYFGGAATHSSVLTICGFFAQQEPLMQVVGGVGNQFLETLKSVGYDAKPYRNPGSGNVIVMLDSESAKIALDRVVVNSGVTPLLHAFVTGVNMDNGSIRSIECVHHEGLLSIEADAFVDASGEADLSTYADGEVKYGDGHGIVQAGTLVMRIGGVAPDVLLNRDVLAKAVATAKADGMTALSKEKGMAVRLPGSNEILALFADEKLDGRDAQSLTEAEMSARNQTWTYIEVFRKYLPGFERAYLISTGPSIGVRETRHVRAEYTLTGEDALHGVRHEDAVARGGWPVEFHKAGQPALYRQIKNKGYYEIPLRSLKVRGIRNLWCAGRIIDADPVAFASARVMGTSFATGHAAGVAAAQYALTKSVDVTQVREELLRQGAFV